MNPNNQKAHRPYARRLAALVAGAAGLATPMALLWGHGAAQAQSAPTTAAACSAGSAGGALVLSGPASGPSAIPAGVYTAGPGGSLEPCAVPSTPAAVATVSVVRPIRPVSLSVGTTNDAAGTGFGPIEFARVPGAPVAFQVVVTNTSPTSVKITRITDVAGGRLSFSPACARTVLAPGASIGCHFTVRNFTPARGTSRFDTVSVTGCESSAPSVCVTTSATSEVLTMAATGSASSRNW